MSIVMRLSRIVFKGYFLHSVASVGLLFFVSSPLWAAQKAVIASPRADVYSESDFDSDILETVNEGESYLISNKVHGPFFKIKLKSGKIGYIPDTDVSIEGKGRVPPRGGSKFGAADAQEVDDPFLRQVDDPDSGKKDKSSLKNKSRKSKSEPENDETDGTEEEQSVVWHGLTLQLINFHQDILGAVQVDDLPALGYKSIEDPVAWEFLASIKTPKYYTEKLDASVFALNLWLSLGFTSDFPIWSWLSVRYGGGLLAHASATQIQAPQKTYNLQELAVGPYIEAAMLFELWGLRYDLSAKYIKEREAYGALGLTVFF